MNISNTVLELGGMQYISNRKQQTCIIHQNDQNVGYCLLLLLHVTYSLGQCREQRILLT